MTLKRLIKIWLVLSVFLGAALSIKFFFWQGKVVSDSLSSSDKPFLNEKAYLPDIMALSGLVMDSQSGTILWEKNSHSKLNPASITKMATAIVALRKYPLDEVVTVKEEYLVGKNMELQEGEKITVANLVYGLLVHSANDAAYILAGGSQGREEFVQKMNDFVSELGLKETHFVNFDGEEDLDHYSTAFDLAHLARVALNNKTFVEAINKREMVVTDLSGEIEHQLETTNELLGVLPEIKGVKTGWTPQSGECFLGLIDLGEGHELVTVILGGEDRFGETKKLVDWAKEAVNWE